MKFKIALIILLVIILALILFFSGKNIRRNNEGVNAFGKGDFKKASQIFDKELESKIPIVKNGFGYVLHSDHSIPKTVNYETLKYYFAKGLELGRY